MLRIRSLLIGVALSALPSVASAAPLTEEELAAKEPTISPKEGSSKASWSTFTQRLPYVAYFEHYNGNFAELKASADKQRESQSEAPGADRPASEKETPGSKVASDASMAAAVGMSVADNLKGGWVPGTPANTASNVLLGVAIAFDVLSWLAKDNTDANIRYQSIRQLRSPSLYLFRFDPELTSEEAAYREIQEGQKLVDAFGVDCEPALYHANVPTARGYVMPGWSRVRRYACGYATGEELGFFGNVREPRDYAVYQMPDRPPLVMLRLEKLNDMEHMPRLLGLEKTQMDTAARVLYQKIEPVLDPRWTVVFTALAADGEWHAYAAREGYVVEYPSVPRR